MSADTGKRITSQQADGIYENLDFAQVIQQYGGDVELSARNAVSRYYKVLAEMHAARIPYEKMAQFLADTFDFVITAKTLREYMRLERQLEDARNSTPRSPSDRKARSKLSQASTPVQPQAPSQPAAIVPTPPVPPIVPPPAPPVLTQKIPAAKSPSANRSSAVATQSTPHRSETSSATPSDADPIEGFTPEELELALQIPSPGDEAATEKFLQALQQIKIINPRRWQELTVGARRAGVNVLGILTPSASHLFNKY
jgi:hypothetical protein